MKRMQSVFYLVVCGLFLFCLSLAAMATPALAINQETWMHCRKDGVGEDLGLVVVAWTWDHPNKKVEPGMRCNEKYPNACVEKCRACVSKFLGATKYTRCYDSAGQCHGACDFW